MRPRRQFVGRVGYAVRWLLWNPEAGPHLRTVVLSTNHSRVD